MLKHRFFSTPVFFIVSNHDPVTYFPTPRVRGHTVQHRCPPPPLSNLSDDVTTCYNRCRTDGMMAVEEHLEA